MKELRTEIELDRTPQEVWEVLADLAAYAEWNPWKKVRDAGTAKGFPR